MPPREDALTRRGRSIARSTADDRIPGYVREQFGCVVRNDRGLTKRHGQTSLALAQDHVGEEDHVLLQHEGVVTVDHRLLHPGGWEGGPHGVAAGPEQRVLVPA